MPGLAAGRGRGEAVVIVVVVVADVSAGDEGMNAVDVSVLLSAAAEPLPPTELVDDALLVRTKLGLRSGSVSANIPPVFFFFSSFSFFSVFNRIVVPGDGRLKSPITGPVLGATSKDGT